MKNLCTISLESTFGIIWQHTRRILQHTNVSRHPVWERNTGLDSCNSFCVAMWKWEEGWEWGRPRCKSWICNDLKGMGWLYLPLDWVDSPLHLQGWTYIKWIKINYKLIQNYLGLFFFWIVLWCLILSSIKIVDWSKNFSLEISKK